MVAIGDASFNTIKEKETDLLVCLLSILDGVLMSQYTFCVQVYGW